MQPLLWPARLCQKGCWHGARLPVGCCKAASGCELEITHDDMRPIVHCAQGFGTIQSCKVLRHQDGTCKGVGFVQMSTPAEATQAIQGLHNKKVSP